MRTLPLLLLCACASSTGGELVAPEVRVMGSGAVQDVSIGDWSLSLDRAELAVGPIYLWSDVPASADAEAGGRLMGEVPDQVVVDVLSGESLVLSDARGLAGQVRSAEVWLEPVDDGPTLRVEGVATRGEQTVPFAASISWESPWIDEEDSVNATLRRRLRGLPAEGTLADDSELELTIDAAAWFSATGLDALPDLEPDPQGVRVPGPDSLFGRDLDQGVRRVSGPAWTATLR